MIAIRYRQEYNEISHEIYSVMSVRRHGRVSFVDSPSLFFSLFHWHDITTHVRSHESTSARGGRHAHAYAMIRTCVNAFSIAGIVRMYVRTYVFVLCVYIYERARAILACPTSTSALRVADTEKELLTRFFTYSWMARNDESVSLMKIRDLCWSKLSRDDKPYWTPGTSAISPSPISPCAASLAVSLAPTRARLTSPCGAAHTADVLWPTVRSACSGSPAVKSGSRR